MNVVVYAAKSGGVARHLQRLVEEIVPQKKLQIYRNPNRLADRLQQPMNGLGIAILFADSDRDLMGFLTLQDLLADIRLILVLPNRELDLIAKAHSLRPRFVTYVDSDFEDLKAVVGKMLEKPAATGVGEAR